MYSGIAFILLIPMFYFVVKLVLLHLILLYKGETTKSYINKKKIKKESILRPTNNIKMLAHDNKLNGFSNLFTLKLRKSLIL